MNTAYTGTKVKLSFWQIWNMCFGFFGIQFGWSLQMGNMSAIYEFLGEFQHGNPDIYDLLDINARTNTTYLELFNETNDKKEKILKLGYKYIEIWENEWKQFKKTNVNNQR